MLRHRTTGHRYPSLASLVNMCMVAREDGSVTQARRGQKLTARDPRLLRERPRGGAQPGRLASQLNRSSRPGGSSRGAALLGGRKLRTMQREPREPQHEEPDAMTFSADERLCLQPSFARGSICHWRHVLRPLWAANELGEQFVERANGPIDALHRVARAHRPLAPGKLEARADAPPREATPCVRRVSLRQHAAAERAACSKTCALVRAVLHGERSGAWGARARGEPANGAAHHRERYQRLVDRVFEHEDLDGSRARGNHPVFRCGPARQVG
jgi:hypothetical protein